VPIAAFDTSYKMSAFLARFTAAKRIDSKLRKLGGRRLAPPETFHVHEHHEGPLFDGEIERARRWAESLLARLDGRGSEEPDMSLSRRSFIKLTGSTLACACAGALGTSACGGAPVADTAALPAGSYRVADGRLIVDLAVVGALLEVGSAVKGTVVGGGTVQSVIIVRPGQTDYRAFANVAVRALIWRGLWSTAPPRKRFPASGCHWRAKNWPSSSRPPSRKTRWQRPLDLFPPCSYNGHHRMSHRTLVGGGAPADTEAGEARV
jgi:hypothetical protein